MAELELSFKDHSKIESRDENRKFGAKCFIENNGKVNCSDIIYEDEKSWKSSRVQIDLLIKVLKNKISDLKDIKKHLKEHKPVHMKDYDEIPSIEEDDFTKDTRPTFRKHNQHQSHFNHDLMPDNRNFENRTAESGEQRQLELPSTGTHRNRNIDQELARINITSPRLHNTHHRPKGNRSHWNTFRQQHHGKKVNLEDLFADNKSKDRITTMAPTSVKESDILSSSSSSSTSKVDLEPETTKNYFDESESSTKFVEEMRTEAPARRKTTNEMRGKFYILWAVTNSVNVKFTGSTHSPRNDKVKTDEIPEDADDADGDYNQEKKSSCLCADLEM